MDATTMQSTSWLVTNLERDYPQFHFTNDNTFRWDPTQMTIFYDISADCGSFLHELAHALLGHASYKKDLELLEMERDAWNYAVSTLSPRYGISITEGKVEDALDTYREWLHARSTCPSCSQTGFESRKNTYNCHACGTQWHVNEARLCGLKRYVLNDSKKRT